MKERYLKLQIILAILLFILENGNTQDPHFSQFYANQVYLNAAYAGFDPGTTLTLNHRNQWFGTPDGSVGNQASFRTYNATLGIRIPCLLESENTNLGLAVSAFKDDTGSAPLTTQGLGGAWSIEQTLKKTKSNRGRTALRFGTQFTFMQRSLSSNYLIFTNQLDPVIGVINNPLSGGGSSPIYSNLNAGILLRHTYNGGKRGRKSKKLNHQNFQYTLGFHIANITRPNISLQGLSNEYRLPMRFTLHGGFIHQIISRRGVSAPIHLAPQFRIDRQGKLNLYTFGTYVFSKAYYFGSFYQFNTGRPDVAEPILNGNLLRNTHILNFNAGIDLKTLLDFGVNYKKRRNGIVLGVSYDFNLSGLSSGATFGTVEINLRYNFSKGGKSKQCGAIHKSELYNGKCPVRF